MHEIYCDCETYSELDLPTVGGLNYARHPSTEVLMWTFYKRSWGKGVAIVGVQDLETALRRALEHFRSTWNAPIILIHWGAFDRFMAEEMAKRHTTKSVFRRPPKTRDDNPQGIMYSPKCLMYDLRQHSLQCGGPAKLENAAAWAGGSKKLSGKQGIKKFSSPVEGHRALPREHLEEWAEFVRYGVRDAEVLAPISEMLGPIGNPGLAHEGWRVVERMNMRGIPIDVPSVEGARLMLQQLEPPLVVECEGLTGGLRPTQTQKLAAWLGLPNCQKLTIEEFMQSDPPKAQKRAAEIRLEVGSSTRAKLNPMMTHLGEGDRVRYQFTYYGAWTRRLTAQGVQPQNFARGFPDEGFFRGLRPGGIIQLSKGSMFEQVKKNIRGFIKAPPGRVFVAADFSQIELRVMAWQAEEEWLLQALREGVDIYRLTGAEIYGMEPEALTEDERYISKRVELASQFGLSGTGIDGDGGLYSRLKQDGIKGFGRARSMHAIEVYRRTHPEIVKFWENMGEACMRCIRTGEDTEAGPIVFEKTRNDLVRVIRPSGQYQCLWEPKIVSGRFDKPVPSYIGRLKTGRMARVETYGARLAQGATQGIAADLLHSAMRTAEEMGYPPIMSIHDEIVTEIDDDGLDHVDVLCEIFSSQIPSWGKGIPVDAEGWQGSRFRK